MRHLRTAVGEAGVDLAQTHADLPEIGQALASAPLQHHRLLQDLGLQPLP